MKNPLISVVIPAFRSGLLILESLESVMAQSFTDFEIVLVDNNASEDTRNAIKTGLTKYPDKIRVVHEPTQGNSSARNRGILEARGPYVALLDDDDQMYPQRLEKQLEVIEKDPEASIVHGRIDYVAYDGKMIVNGNRSNDVQDWARILFWDHPRFLTDPVLSVAPSVSLFSRKLALEIGGFDERFNPCFVEDTEFSLRMWEKGPLLEIPEPLVAFRLPSPEFLKKKRENVSNWVQATRNLNLFFSILAGKYYDQKNRESVQRFQKIRSQWTRELSQDVLKAKDGQEAARFLLKRALRDRPGDVKNWKWFIRTYLPPKQRLQALNLPAFYSKNLGELVNPEELTAYFRLPGE
ncbi:MAG: glycosyltransferase [Nitrospirae bacterium]|nr:glycosyltransferase [Nitrospirota bacterium]